MKKILVGFTVLTVLAWAVSALAWGGSDITVENSNKACVENNVTVEAYTGMNTANGDDGGDAEASVFGNGTAKAGNGGAGGDGGSITTGDAYAKAKVTNIVNTNRTKIKATCTDCPSVDDVEVENRNRAHIDNEVGVMADTGVNEANGDDGGDAKASVFSFGGGLAKVGNGGTGGDGGTIDTGSAYSKAKVFNMVNTNVTRIRR